MELIKENKKTVPLTILTGFLGAGKTTLLNRILKGSHGLKAAVLVNDFGKINIDAELVVGVKDDMISLSNGCVCCQIRDDLIESVENLLDSQKSIEYILLEASGVADPSGIFVSFTDPKLRDRIRLDSVTCVVDAEQAFAYPEYPGVAHLKLRQIGFSDMIILNKVDLAGEKQVEKVRSWINHHMNRVRVYETNFCEVPFEILMAAGKFRAAQSIEMKENHSHKNPFVTWSYETEKPICLEKLYEVFKKLPENVFRAKGIVNSVDSTERRAVVNLVGRRTDIVLDEAWGNKKQRTQIVAIGTAGIVDDNYLKEKIDSCIVDV